MATSEFNGTYNAGGVVHTTWYGANTGTGDTWQWQPGPYYYQPPVEIRHDNSMEAIERLLAKAGMNKATQTKEEREPMRGLFEVFVVEPKDGEVVFQDHVVAADEANAKIKVGMKALEKVDDLDDYDIIVRRIGDVREKRKVQEVKVVEK